MYYVVNEFVGFQQQHYHRQTQNGANTFASTRFANLIKELATSFSVRAAIGDGISTMHNSRKH